ncbi:MAG TPA: hypothetical protein VK974_01185 [Methylophilaceae bacterium]|nr:hypothetical protein [Methylophilaceae bacterium]
MGINAKQKAIEVELFNRYGPLIGGCDLRQCLGYKSSASFNRAAKLGILRLSVFEIESRRGKFALTRDVAIWLKDVSTTSLSKANNDN